MNIEKLLIKDPIPKIASAETKQTKPGMGNNNAEQPAEGQTIKMKL